MNRDSAPSMRLPALLMLVAGLGATLLACHLAILAQDERIRIGFQRDVDKVALDTENRLKAHFDVLLGIKGLYASSESVERDEFASFISELDLTHRYPGFQSIQFVRRVAHEDLRSFEESVRRDRSLVAEGYPNFAMRPQNDQPVHYVIEFNEPMRGNEAAFGLDLASIPVHKATIERAIELNAIVSTEPIRLQQEIGNQSGFVARAPVFKRGMPIETLEQRRAALLGMAAIVFRVGNLMQEVVDRSLLPQMGIHIEDVGMAGMPPIAAAARKTLYATEAHGDAIAGMNIKKQLIIGERQWEMEFDALPGQRYSRSNAVLVLLGLSGVIISFLSAALLAVFGRRRWLGQRLRVALEEQHAIQENAVVGMVLVAERKVRRTNRGIEEMLGYAPGEMVGLPTSFVFSTLEQYEQFSRESLRVIYTGEPFETERPLVRKDGSLIWCLMHGKAIDPQKPGNGIVWVLHDITDRKISEAALVEANAKLERSLAEGERQKQSLQAAHDELADVLAKLTQAQSNLIFSEKMASLGSLVAGIAHELNTPIGNSLLAATAMSDRVAEFTEAVQAGNVKRSELTEHLQSTREGCILLAGSLHKAANLIASFKQVAVDQTSDERRSFDLRAVLLDTLATYAVQLRRGNCEATLDAPGQILLDSHPGSVGQVMNNLIGNALLHAFEGRNEGHLHIAARRLDQEWVEIVFSDDGVGMPPEILHKVFDPFFTTKMGQGGSGLGMNIVYNIVTAMLGGRITIDSVPGRGTTIRIAIPRVAPLTEGGQKQALF